MNVTGQVMSVEFDVTIPKKDGGSYPGARFSYRDSTGALKEQAFHNNSLKFNPTLKTQLAQLEVGKGFTMVKEKEGEFWNVKNIYGENQTPAAPVSTSSASSPSPARTSPKSTYETPEERAAKQVMIVRQSSISSAVALAAAGSKTKITTEDIIETAKKFEAYVMGSSVMGEVPKEVSAMNALIGLDDDIPE